MHDLFIEGISIRQHLETGPDGSAQVEGNWLFFPEVRTLGAGGKPMLRAQEKLLQSLLEHSLPAELPRRVAPDAEIEEKSIPVTLEPPSGLPLWVTPLELTFPYLTWEQNGSRIAHVPVFDIETVIPEGKTEEEAVEDDIRFALNRRRVNRNLFELSLLQRCREMEVERLSWNAYPLSPRERTMREEGDEKAVEQVLHEVGKRIDNLQPDPVFEREKELRQIASCLRGRKGVSSILLVGESGVGKTALIQTMAAEQKNHDLKPKQVYHTPGSRIVAGMCGYGQWQERCGKMAREASSGTGKILYFGNLSELLEVGQSAASSESVGSFFRPWLIRGQFVAIAECTPAQLSLIEQKDPRILEAFRQIRIDPPSPKVARSILEQAAAQRPNGVAFGKPALHRIFTLHLRYAGYSAMPGRMLNFLRRMAARPRRSGKRPAARVTAPEVTRAFALETGLPSFLLDDEEPLDFGKTTTWFHRRIKGQDEAVRHVVDTIATIKARLSRPGRPLASFLFAGPTGVGKTELAKTLAEFFYGSRERMLRLDMSEYSTPGSAGRLASGGSREPEGILTSKMRDQPFSVLLLDEFEKADDSVFDLFLQVLGEARLTDGAGRLADFSNAIIILTSNLGAAEFRVAAPGFADPDSAIEPRAMDHFVEAAKKRFRPEFFNRIGRVVPFLPLDEQSVREVIDREISKLDRRDGLRGRELTLIVADEVVDAIAGRGFDPRYGARPLKRTIEKEVLGPIGEYLVEHPAVRRGSLEISSIDGKRGLQFSFRAEVDQLGRGEEAQLQQWKRDIPNLRRWYQILNQSHLVSELHSEARRLERRIKHRPEPGDHQFLAHTRSLLDQFTEECDAVLRLEETLLITGFENASHRHLAEEVDRAPDWNGFCDLLRDIYLWIQKSSQRIVLVLTSDDDRLLSNFAGVYREVARKEYGCQVKAGYFRDPPADSDLDEGKDGYRKPHLPETAEEIESLFSGKLPGDCLAIALQFSAAQVGLRFSSETGIHRFVDRNGHRSHVRVTGFMDDDFAIETGWVEDATLSDREFQASEYRRIWNEEESSMQDAIWGSSLHSRKIDPRKLPSKFSTAGVCDLIELTLIEKALDAIRK